MGLRIEEVTIYCIVNDENSVERECYSKEEAERWLSEMLAESKFEQIK